MVILLHLLLLSVSLFLFILSRPVSAVDPITESLLSLKSEVIDDSNALGDWVLPTVEPNSSTQIHGCFWSGVKCNENSTMVVGLDLSMKNLGGVLSGNQFGGFLDLLDLNLSNNSFSGNLPPGIFNLIHLRTLDISRNNFSGQFPAGISSLENLENLDAFSNIFSGNLPSEVSKLKSLKMLNFAGSYFNGSIPSEYGFLGNLEFIHLAANSLTGKLPPELGKLKALTHMEIGYNAYEGNIPWQFGNLSELQYLDISGANLSGQIPKEIGNLTKLESLFMFRNFLDGIIPQELGRISSLQSLDLSDNILSGPIPETFSDLKKLKLLSIMYNEMTGTVPEGLAKLPGLEHLHIWSNFFNGSLPESLGRHSKIKSLDVSTNRFVAGIPPGICSGGALQRLIMFSNRFSGRVDPSISNCPSLIRVRLEDNLFSGEISLNFSKLPDIAYLDLSGNNFSGGIPADLNSATKLGYFNVSYNPDLRGTIPEKTWTILSLRNFSASNCGIYGNIPPFKECKSVSVIELSFNNLSGVIPENYNCKELMKMDLSSNKLTGQIPDRISATLKILNVSFNDISGSIPKQFWAMDSSYFSGNPKLCGPPLRACSNGLDLRSRKAQRVIWALITCGVVVLSIIAGVFVALYYYHKAQWKTVSFNELHQFKLNDILRSFDSTDPGSVRKVVLPTGITVSVKRVKWAPSKATSEFINQLGNARHKNLTRLLGFCHNKDLAYLVYDYLPNGNLSEIVNGGEKREWETKLKVVIGIARGLCYLHHDSKPAIPHGDLKGSNVVFDENMEAHLVHFGIKSLIRLHRFSSSLPSRETKEAEELRIAEKEELFKDIYNFGKLVMEVLANGRAKSVEVAANRQMKPHADGALLREVLFENDISPSNPIQVEEVKRVLEVGLLCTRIRASNRPSMQEALKLLQGQKCQESNVPEVL
ncbi:unnamed protein product [Cuscuta epithymum]|uniref:Protein kinase domain-containing protein n=1 Tax=Cuscuta epithymum TaxID=186058 RepID=A0AAV0FKZ5_9ASTE|nr:unnamed protein product [Cuscuta epithymum]